MSTVSYRALALVLALVVGCKKTEEPPPPTDTEGDADTDADADSDADVDTGPSSSSGTTGATADTAPALEVIDCATLPANPTLVTQLSAPRGYHDVAFDLDGNIIGSDDDNLIKVAHDGSSALFVPGMGTVQGMDWLPDGDLVVAMDSTGSLIRVTPAGGTSVLATDVGAYGVIVGSDGMVYVANYRAIVRIDPATGDKEEIVQRPDLSPRVLNFSPDSTKLYIGTLGGTNGAVYVVDLDANLDPLGPPAVFATGVGTGAYHDTLGVDVCGNLYVADYGTNALYRVSTSGQVSTFVDMDFNKYGHGMDWGSGIGGWLDDAIYLSQPYNNNNVVELVIGVPSRTAYGTVTLTF
ncbi:MAG: SMP-30/gluconolactonase/LRE family protein [Myxococcota bacterium]